MKKVNKKKTYGVGIIGLGRIYPRHIDDSINQIDGLELVAVCDILPDLAKQVGKKYNVTYYEDYKKLINDLKVDIVVICTSNTKCN